MGLTPDELAQLAWEIYCREMRGNPNAVGSFMDLDLETRLVYLNKAQSTTIDPPLRRHSRRPLSASDAVALEILKAFGLEGQGVMSFTLRVESGKLAFLRVEREIAHDDVRTDVIERVMEHYELRRKEG